MHELFSKLWAELIPLITDHSKPYHALLFYDTELATVTI